MQSVMLQSEEPTRTSFGKRLKTIRESMGMTQRSLAIRCGLHQPGIARIEDQGALPSIKTLNKLAAGLHISIELLLEDRVTDVRSIRIDTIADICKMLPNEDLDVVIPMLRCLARKYSGPIAKKEDSHVQNEADLQ